MLLAEMFAYAALLDPSFVQTHPLKLPDPSWTSTRTPRGNIGMYMQAHDFMPMYQLAPNRQLTSEEVGHA